MKKLLAVGIILLLVGMGIPSTGNVVEKSSNVLSFDGNTLYVGGSGEGNYTRIQYAIDNASDGDTVFVYNGTYVENVVVDKSINLKGEDRSSTIIDSRRSGKNIVVENAHNVVISGFTLQNATFSLVLWDTCKYSLIYDNVIRNNAYNGITLYCSHCIIRSNIIKNNGQSGISCSNPTYGYRNEISQNIICNNEGDGIHLCSDGNNITENMITENNQSGIWLWKTSSNNSIYHNNIINNKQNAYDTGNNSWDNGYPSCGNYWDDYTGNDSDGDGIGDTPYLIPSGNNSDRYPLMEPYGMTELTIGIGLFRILGSIKNIGSKTAFNVHWKITIDGGIILLGRHSSGIIPKPLLPDEETEVSSKLVFGIGRIMITVELWADNVPYVSETISGLLLLFFIKINPGGGI
ncbi:MAG: right-handed parallel beta-helix repeat-containing protein [Thermoplasmatales archaeon]|nr:MAG: right-handed parallel beta-helix repeat-containing protein [Thermoplasmatales archaeon]